MHLLDRTMRIKILGPGALGNLLSALFREAGHELLRHESGRIRVRLPQRFLSVDLPAADGLADYLFVCSDSLQVKPLDSEILSRERFDRLVAFNLQIDQGSAPAVLSLLTAVMLQPGDVELNSPKSLLLFKKNRDLKRLFADIKPFGITCQEVDRLEPFADNFFVGQLLFLPVAMCHSTRGVFLSYAEGRDIARRVLGEGLETFRRRKHPLKRLPIMDVEGLLKAIESGEKLNRGRQTPGCGYNPLLQSLLRDESFELLNRHLVNLAAEAGVDARWNWRLIQKLSRVQHLGFYKDPRELYSAIK